MSRHIDADALIADMQERYCKPCKEKGEDYNEVRCRACWVDDAIGDVDGFGDNSIDIVRCQECKHWHELIDAKGQGRCDADEHNPFRVSIGISTADFYCSYGERKESE